LENSNLFLILVQFNKAIEKKFGFDLPSEKRFFTT